MFELTGSLLTLLLLVNITSIELLPPEYQTTNRKEFSQSENYHYREKRGIIIHDDEKKTCKEGEEKIKIGNLFTCVSCKRIASKCKSVCTQPCKICGICDCDQGYAVDQADKQNCIPLCLKGCRDGTCIAPETCHCNPGYSNVYGNCQPVCTEPCANGKCVAPEYCECLLGYNMSDTNTCEPYCSRGCHNGSCIAPETCICKRGWHRGDTGCTPVCKYDCGMGICVAPNVCNCHPGYKLSNDNGYHDTESPTCVAITKINNVTGAIVNKWLKYWVWIAVASLLLMVMFIGIYFLYL